MEQQRNAEALVDGDLVAGLADCCLALVVEMVTMVALDWSDWLR